MNPIFVKLLFLLGSLLRYLVLLTPFLALWWLIKAKGRFSRIAALLLLLLSFAFGHITLGPSDSGCRYSVLNEEHSRSFSSVASSIELSGKGMHFSDVKDYLERYRKENNLKELKLCRKCERTLFTWLNFHNWSNEPFHPRWSIPICPSNINIFSNRR